MNLVDHPHGGGEGKDLRWPPPGQPQRQARGRTRHPNKASGQVDRPPPAHRQEAPTGNREDMPRSLKKGPCRRPPDEEGGRPERQGHQERDQDVIASIDDRARHARSHLAVHNGKTSTSPVFVRTDDRSRARGVAPTRTFRGQREGRPRVAVVNDGAPVTIGRPATSTTTSHDGDSATASLRPRHAHEGPTRHGLIRGVRPARRQAILRNRRPPATVGKVVHSAIANARRDWPAQSRRLKRSWSGK